jgi:hypothetical protein
VDEELAEDAVADQLAERLMHASAGNLGEDDDVDPEEFAYSDGSGDSDSSGEENDQGKELGDAGSSEDVDSDEADVPDGGDASTEEAEEDEDEAEDGWELAAFGGTDDSDVEDKEVEATTKKRKMSGKQMLAKAARGSRIDGKQQRRTMESVFADASDSD